MTALDARSAQETRTRLLAATATLLSTRGYAATHLDDIAELVGVRASAIYHYFRSRDELVAAVMHEGQSRARLELTAGLAALPAGASIAERIATAVDIHLQVELRLSDFARAVIRNAGHVPAEVRAGVAIENSAIRRIWSGLLEEADEAGLLHAGLDAQIACLLVIGALNWATEWWTPAVPIESVVSQAQQMVVAGLLRRPTAS